ncbi:transglutaminase superfamily protein [Jatrophihabitans sp. GAS493]|uniref:transglutaminase-like domain-containing protein n=1 Tax=Jatrophihabitans sp. GAS493 TaxID=1907575 RepID=UPI000BC087C4|nr:transglutaminase family protein [Jatrophihabitans sp. GAS493]SOD71266.1 transglutaminase superfamily protein [Jatrophihabitans sp. GAS493]
MPDLSSDLTRIVGAHLVVDVYDPVRMMLQVAVADEARVTDDLEITLGGTAIEAREVHLADVGRVHLLDAKPGRLVLDYTATATGRSEPISATITDEITYIRPSRYAESDRLGAIALAEFSGIESRAELLAAVSSWVGSQLSYVPGSSGPTDGAVDTLLHRQGVCRDYAHLVVALLRAMEVPARLVAVYAPGLEPMDFHAVAEALVDGVWRVVDATLLAPRETLLRISTGRDAADTAFLSIYGGAAQLQESEVTAYVASGDLPIEDVRALVSLS